MDGGRANGCQAGPAGTLILLMALSGCGGGGGGANGAPPPAPAPPAPPAPVFSVGGRIEGLSGAGLTLRNNGGPELPVSNGTFTIATGQASGTNYDIVVSAQPTQPWQTCLVERGQGAVGSSDVDDIRIVCATNRYSINVSVQGLTGSGLTLQNNGADRLAVAANGTRTFATPVDSGAEYDVTVSSQPLAPAQDCVVAAGSGTVADADVSDVTVTCSDLPPPPQFTVGGAVSGLHGAGLQLGGLAGQLLDVSADGVFTFARGAESGTQYHVAVTRQPVNPAQTCVVANGDGLLVADVSDISVTCTDVVFSSALDPGFGSGGMRLIDFNGGDDRVRAVALQDDGKIVLAGEASSANNVATTFALARLEPDGTLDGTFGQGGLVTTPIGSIAATAAALAIQPDGRILVAGRAFVTSRFDIAVARYNSDGTLDGTFGTGGVVTTNLSNSDDATGIALQADGKIIVAGTTRPQMNDFVVLRYLQDGTPDTGFDGDGHRLIDFGGGNDQAAAVAVRSDGGIIVAGSADGGGVPAFAFALSEADGSAPAFAQHRDGANGIGVARAIAIQPDGKWVLGGSVAEGSVDQFALTRYTVDGAVDVTFGSGGRTHGAIGSGDSQAFGLAARADFKWALAGRSFNGVNFDFALARYQPDGAPDPAFGDQGVMTLALGGDDDEAFGIAAQPDLKLIVAGSSVKGEHSDFAIVRILD